MSRPADIPMPNQYTQTREQVREYWQARSARERLILGGGIALLSLAIVWLIAVQPALRTLRTAPVQLDQLDAQLQTLQRLAAESKTLRNPVQVSPEQAAAALKAATDRLGEGSRITVQGERATLSVTNASGPALQAWLLEARSAAHARAIDVQLTRNPQSNLSGSVIVSLGVGS